MIINNVEVDKVKPYGPNILVRRHKVETKSIGGIALPETKGEKSMFCDVLAIGAGITVTDPVTMEPKRYDALPGGKIGDIVVLRQIEGFRVFKGVTEDDDILIADGRCVQGILRKKGA